MIALTVVGFAAPASAQMEEYVEIPPEIVVPESGVAVAVAVSNPGDNGLDIELSTGGAFEIVTFTAPDCVASQAADYFGLTCEAAEFWETTVVLVPTAETLAEQSVEGTLFTTLNAPFSFAGETPLIWENPNPAPEPEPEPEPEPAPEPEPEPAPEPELPPAPDTESDLLCGGEIVTVNLATGDIPTDGNDVILGTDGPDIINAGFGNDIICGLGGDDVINAGNGADMVLAGPGDDTVQAGQGRDTVLGEGGDDVIVGGKGKDTLIGGGGNDDIRGNDGTDTIDGGLGDDELRGGQNADVITGGAGADLLVGGIRPDTLDGGRGVDSYNGGAGTDTCAADPQGRPEIASSCEEQ